MYWEPEVLDSFGSNKRGRAVDIFALGCIFIEISTALLVLIHFTLHPGLLIRFANFRYNNNSRLFALCPGKLLQWIRFICGKSKVLSYPILWSITALAFLMLDPNPYMRITARRAVALLNTESAYGWSYVEGISCAQCGSATGNQSRNSE